MSDNCRTLRLMEASKRDLSTPKNAHDADSTARTGKDRGSEIQFDPVKTKRSPVAAGNVASPVHHSVTTRSEPDVHVKEAAPISGASGARMLFAIVGFAFTAFILFIVVAVYRSYWDRAADQTWFDSAGTSL